MPLIIREAKAEADWLAGIWPIFQEIVRAGDTLAYPPETDELSAREYWLLPAPARVFVAIDDANGSIVGSSFVKPNQPGLGGHVANAAFMVAAAASGRCRSRIGGARYRVGPAGEFFRDAVQLRCQYKYAGNRALEESRVFDYWDHP